MKTIDFNEENIILRFVELSSTIRSGTLREGAIAFRFYNITALKGTFKANLCKRRKKKPLSSTPLASF